MAHTITLLTRVSQVQRNEQTDRQTDRETHGLSRRTGPDRAGRAQAEDKIRYASATPWSVCYGRDHSARPTTEKRAAYVKSNMPHATAPHPPGTFKFAVELHEGYVRTSLAAALLRQHIDGVARASSRQQRERVARALLGPAHNVGARLERCARFRDQLAATTRRQIELGNRRLNYQVPGF